MNYEYVSLWDHCNLITKDQKAINNKVSNNNLMMPSCGRLLSFLSFCSEISGLPFQNSQQLVKNIWISANS